MSNTSFNDFFPRFLIFIISDSLLDVKSCKVWIASLFKQLYRKLNRETRVRKSILSSLTKDVLENGYVQTTEERAKEVRKFVDKMITYAKKGDLGSRRKALAFLNNDKDLVKKLFDEYAVTYKDRSGGYTRIIKLKERIGDDALIVRLELV